ncbi:hypothetical protein RhiirA1_406770 [Rhizophagus irregularis]|uniref:Uncharacterized protein n=2 Tax=Rhizophagus irregularis TaxID=588596 RepID=A0A2N0SKN7_9GLOM|nr:hypothetical protein RhiirA1_406770 [Rhizophagus irregularis]
MLSEESFLSKVQQRSKCGICLIFINNNILLIFFAISEYWQKPYTKWSIESWDAFYFKEHPNATIRNLRSYLAGELRSITENSVSRIKEKALKFVPTYWRLMFTHSRECEHSIMCYALSLCAWEEERPDTST